MARRRTVRPATRAPTSNSGEEEVELRAADWIDEGVEADELFNDALLRGSAEFRLRWYLDNQPDAILDREGALRRAEFRAQLGSGGMSWGDPGPIVTDPWKLEHV